MNKDTPALEIKQKDLDKNAWALKSTLEQIDTPIRKVVDIRYGLGGWAKVVMEKYPKAIYLGYEQNKETYLAAWKDIPDSQRFIVVKPFPNLRTTFKGIDLLLADFNNLTVLKRRPLDEALAITSPKWVVFTDVASSKLHLNYRSYGLCRPSLNDYWNKFDIEGYTLEFWEQTHHAASSALYRRD